MIEIRKTDNIKTISEIHKEIFNETFPVSSYKEKQKYGNLCSYLIYDKENVGYCLIEKNNETLDYYIWLGGILKKYRKKGYWKNFINYLIIEAKKEKYKKIKIATYNHWKDMLGFLIKNNFRIIGVSEGKYGDKIKIHLEYEIGQ
ncbi:MAG: GNAT family N-acetyltransferase [Leptotrichiaceae bacterium]|nr:GNAT family N-acetyltransferase [Leptotrichiaceae bacterium]